MDIPAPGDTLLVGEGDFSFCISMVTKLPPDKHSTITATSLETDGSIQKHQDALDNIQALRKKGVTVRLNTDATKLHEDPYFTGRTFSRVMFNFPHIGGKSNHKKNRRLLKEFFTSATKVLESRGQIYMTLCKGQGGTPADRPMRAWHDSWQVVAMAADADLILTQVFPFHADEYRTYSSTGFRSQDKGFNTTNAITHVFELAERAEIPHCLAERADIPQGGTVVPVGIHGERLVCPRYVFNKLLAVRSIRQNDHHPLNRLHSCLTRFLTTNSDSEVCDLGMLQPITTSQTEVSGLQPEDSVVSRGLLLRSSSETPEGLLKSSSSSSETPEGLLKSSSSETPEGLQDLQSSDTGGLISENMTTPIDDLFETFPEDLEYDKSESASYRYRVVCGHKELVRIAVGRIQDTNSSSDKIYTACCPVFPRWQIFSPQLPAFTYQEVVVKRLPLEEDQHICVEKSKQQTVGIPDQAPHVGPDLNPNCLHKDSSKVSETGHHLEIVNREWLNMAVEETVNGIVEFIRLDCSGEDLDVEVDYLTPSSDTERGTGERTVCVGSISALNKCSVDGDEGETNTGVASSLITEKVVLGNIYILVTETETHPVHYVAVTLDMGILACIKYGLTDRRLLWSQDYRVLELFKNFEENSMKADAKARKLLRPSLYPLTRVHDMSFWLNETVAFDEARYFDVIRDVAGDNVTSVELIDTFVDPATGRNSRTYRLIFQSPDQAFSRDTSNTLQSLVRLEVEKCLKITLR